jgi:zinc transport system substrate-binding protein
MIVMRFQPAAALSCAVALAVSACGGSDAAEPVEKPSVVAAFYPYEFLAQRIGGDAVTVEGLTKPNTEPHDLELTPRQVASIGAADLVIHHGGFQPAVDEAVAQEAKDQAIDVATLVPLQAGPDEHEGEAGEEHAEDHGKDPHVWLDPSRYGVIGKAIGEALADVDAAHAADYRSRAAALATELTALDEEFSSGLSFCKRRTIVTSHEAFGYLASRYDLEQIGISGLSPEAEPSPARVAKVGKEVRRHGVTTVFFERLVSPKAAKTLADDAGAGAGLLDPVEGVADPAKDDYFSVMRANLAALQKALSC